MSIYTHSYLIILCTYTWKEEHFPNKIPICCRWHNIKQAKSGECIFYLCTKEEKKKHRHQISIYIILILLMLSKYIYSHNRLICLLTEIGPLHKKSRILEHYFLNNFMYELLIQHFQQNKRSNISTVMEHIKCKHLGGKAFFKM